MQEEARPLCERVLVIVEDLGPVRAIDGYEVARVTEAPLQDRDVDLGKI